MSGSSRSGAIENQIVNALAWGSVVYARRMAGTTSAAEPESQALSTAQRWPSGLSSSWRSRWSAIVVGTASSTISARSSAGLPRNGASAGCASASEDDQRERGHQQHRVGRDRRVGLGERDDLDGVLDEVMRVVQPRHHLVEVGEGERLHGEPEVLGLGQRAQVEAGDDAEEAGPGAAGGPEQVGVLVLRGPDQLAVGGDHVDRDDVLRRPAPAAGVPALAALEQEAADADGRAVPAGEEPAALLEERPELDAALDRGRGRDDLRRLVVRELLESAEVDDQRVGADRPLRPAVPAGAYGDLPAVRLREPDGVDDLGLGPRLARRRPADGRSAAG